ncbi:wall-associated receptor kinase 3-like [Triticum aestivum]|uniref:wall-associated receptor kinase 3-like n=1 Tax=Triticum aestivum TaxID=4565 RepID=UPI001D013F10|nr:wall-associated receptor kinase 3-like [Triticum aestivum]
MMLTWKLMAATLLLLLLPALAATAPAPAAAPMIGMPDCDTTCGNVSVPYPFGVGPPRCYHSPGFNLSCDRRSDPPWLLLGDGGMLQVDHISLLESKVLVKRTAGVSGSFRVNLRPYRLSAGSGSGSGSGAGNELILTGCNVRATLKNGDATIGGCSSLCDDGDGPLLSRPESRMLCSGIGCCHVAIVVNHQTAAVFSYDVQLEWFGRNRSADEARMPARVFVASEGWVEQRRVLNRLLKIPSKDALAVAAVPLWLDWEVGLGGATAGSNSECHVGTGGGGGYTCRCKEGYHGNPYITDGCKDINECELPEDYPCPGDGICRNTDGGFDCECPPGTHGNASSPGGYCIPFASVKGANGGPSCNRSCGDVAVPYPFGIGPEYCYRPGFNLTCDYGSSSSSDQPPRLLLDGYGAFQVQNISIENATVSVTSSVTVIDAVSRRPYSFHLGDYFTGHGDAFYSLSAGNEYYQLSARNELILVGCNVQATLLGGSSIITGCATFCSEDEPERMPIANNGGDNKNCYGVGCCQAHISSSKDDMSNELRLIFRFADHEQDVLRPPYALIAEQGWFDNRNVTHQQVQALGHNSRSAPKVPLVLHWEVLQSAGLPAADANSYPDCAAEAAADICKDKHSFCLPGNRGYSCQCMLGHGNPYLVDGGCQDLSVSNVGLFIWFGIIISMTCIRIFYCLLQVKLDVLRGNALKRKFFKLNHGQLLKRLISQRAGVAERMIMTLKELEKATQNFDKDLEVGSGGHGTVYKGILLDQHVVAIKKPNKILQREIDEFINEVVILSQINHRNVVKLYGCCLETEVPMLVYEFISNGTLYEHLHVEEPESLSWSNRLRIVMEAAKSLAYLHTAASTPIIHRDIKSTNILLDDTLTAKVADFGASKHIPVDISGVTTRAQGTRGYWDPMYFYTGRLTEKSDVYSFGVVLVELLTRKKPFSYSSSEDEGLVEHFVTLFKEGNLLQILDPQVIEEGGKEVQEVSCIAVACVQLRREDRPTMREVELTLEAAHTSRKQTLDIAFPSTKVESNIKGSTRRHSMEQEFISSAEYPR